MSLVPAFWDTSALIPLCVTQPQSPFAEALYARYSIIAWWATEVEIRSGLTRLLRMGSIPQSQFLAGKQLAQTLVRSWHSVQASNPITAEACSLLELHSLRAGDALQLGAALEAFTQKPQGQVFITSDQRLADAARLTGFAVEFF
jgi:predicted nucleic acid-binding protein